MSIFVNLYLYISVGAVREPPLQNCPHLRRHIASTCKSHNPIGGVACATKYYVFVRVTRLRVTSCRALWQAHTSTRGIRGAGTLGVTILSLRTTEGSAAIYSTLR